MNGRSSFRSRLPFVACWLLPAICCVVLCGCRAQHEQKLSPPYDRPFPLGQVTDSSWETQQTNAEASDFIFYDHEFVGDTAELTLAGKKHLLQVALRLEQVPFPVVVEQTPTTRRNQPLEAQRRQAIVDELTRLGLEMIDARVVVAPAIAPGITVLEGEAAYYSTLTGAGRFYGGVGRRFGGTGGVFR